MVLLFRLAGRDRWALWACVCFVVVVVELKKKRTPATVVIVLLGVTRGRALARARTGIGLRPSGAQARRTSSRFLLVLFLISQIMLLFEISL